MATKKQKRARMKAKHEAEMAELKRSNAAALLAERKRREAINKSAWEDNHNKRHLSPESMIEEQFLRD